MFHIYKYLHSTGRHTGPPHKWQQSGPNYGSDLSSQDADLKVLSQNTDLGIAVLQEFMGQVVETIPWPPSLVLSWITPKCHSHRDLHNPGKRWDALDPLQPDSDACSHWTVPLRCSSLMLRQV